MQVRRLLSSAEPTTVRIGNAPEVGDPEMQALQQARLLALGMRTMTLPLGRGALTLGQSNSLMLDRMQNEDHLRETRPIALCSGDAFELDSHGLRHTLTHTALQNFGCLICGLYLRLCYRDAAQDVHI